MKVVREVSLEEGEWVFKECLVDELMSAVFVDVTGEFTASHVTSGCFIVPVEGIEGRRVVSLSIL